MQSADRLKSGHVGPDGRVFFSYSNGKEKWVSSECYHRHVIAPREASRAKLEDRRKARAEAKAASKAKWEADMAHWAATKEERKSAKMDRARIKAKARRDRLRNEAPEKLREEYRRDTENRKCSPKRLAWLASRKAEVQARKDARAAEIAARREFEAKAKAERMRIRSEASAERKARLAAKPRVRRPILTPEQRLEVKRLEKANYKHRRRCRIREQESKATPSQIRAAKVKARGICHYCRGKFKALTQDHITPIAKGGTHTLDNIVFACHACNSEKRDLTPEEYGRRHGLLLV